MSLREVTKAQFFAILGPMDVNPHVVIATLKERRARSIWETPRRYVVGESLTDTHGVEPTRFWLAE